MPCRTNHPLTSQNVLLIDTREPDEVINGTIPSAVILPLSRLEAALSPKFNPGDFQRVSERAEAELTV